MSLLSKICYQTTSISVYPKDTNEQDMVAPVSVLYGLVSQDKQPRMPGAAFKDQDWIPMVQGLSLLTMKLGKPSCFFTLVLLMSL
jgi:hypothetical protein